MIRNERGRFVKGHKQPWRKKHLFKKVCLLCNKDFYVPKNQIPRRKYCSIKCSSLMRKGNQFAKGSIPWNKGTFGVMKKNSGSFKKGSKHRRFKGWTKHQGYILIYSPNHPFKDSHNFVKEHRLVMEKHLGRYLKPSEIIHHINHIRDDNRIENLMIVKQGKSHAKLHPVSEKTRKRMSESRKGKIPWNKKFK